MLCQLCEAFYWLMPRLSTFHQRYPEIEIQVATSTGPLTEFNEHFDVALQSTGRPSGVHGLMFTAADEVFPVCSPHYLRTHKALQVRDLKSHTLFALSRYAASLDAVGCLVPGVWAVVRQLFRGLGVR
nr:hypothetical protein GCM10020185_81420 [Pseudomonas brassicacearum subsp. brassicacearum]